MKKLIVLLVSASSLSLVAGSKKKANEELKSFVRTNDIKVFSKRDDFNNVVYKFREVSKEDGEVVREEMSYPEDACRYLMKSDEATLYDKRYSYTSYTNTSAKREIYQAVGKRERYHLNDNADGKYFKYEVKEFEYIVCSTPHKNWLGRDTEKDDHETRRDLEKLKRLKKRYLQVGKKRENENRDDKDVLELVQADCFYEDSGETERIDLTEEVRIRFGVVNKDTLELMTDTEISRIERYIRRTCEKNISSERRSSGVQPRKVEETSVIQIEQKYDSGQDSMFLIK